MAWSTMPSLRKDSGGSVKLEEMGNSRASSPPNDLRPELTGRFPRTTRMCPRATSPSRAYPTHHIFGREKIWYAE